MQAIILYSVGSPEVLSKHCIKQYLNCFLSDKLVVRIPGFLWRPILHSFILTTRPERLLTRYESIFNEDGSNPYLKMTEHLAQQLEDSLNPTLAAATLSEHNDQLAACNQPGFSLAQGPAVSDSIPDKLTDSVPASDSDSATSGSVSAASNSSAYSGSDSAKASIAALTQDPHLAALDCSTDILMQDTYLVRCAYAYCQPSLTQVVNECVNAGAQEIITIPLFPQYSDTTSKRPWLTLNQLKKRYPQCTFKWVKSYSDHELYIQALVRLIKPYLEQASAQAHSLTQASATDQAQAQAQSQTQAQSQSQIQSQSQAQAQASAQIDSKSANSATTEGTGNSGGTDSTSSQGSSGTNIGTDAPRKSSKFSPHLLISFHSLPQSYIKLGDPYLKECQATIKALTSALGLTEQQYTVAFQSKLGPMTWLKPYLEDACHELLRTHHTNLVVAAPGFSMDCLETLYDLGQSLKQQFLTQGGEHFALVPCLNDSKLQVELLKALISTATEIPALPTKSKQ